MYDLVEQATVQCDRCKRTETATFDKRDNPTIRELEWVGSLKADGWMIDDGTHYCPDCADVVQ